ncbi:MAG: hypothetical protein Q8M09_04900 [Pseudomonadota bacterium]|nr:hypothetical protein [Pseudomonadota bacterium]MDP1903574.1 hypothetical protein [Pseudomonadota bacterium]MDP2351431.1 hypothetical protein [Pseudomonadota bacterium]
MNKILILPLLLMAGQALAFPWYSSGDNVRGAELMTPQERKEYASRLPNMKSMDECRTYMSAHNLELDKRAKERGVSLPPISGDPCAVMKTLGRIK